MIEDSRNGLLAAKSAYMNCIITTNGDTQNENFTEADDVYPELGDGPDTKVSIESLKKRFS